MEHCRINQHAKLSLGGFDTAQEIIYEQVLIFICNMTLYQIK